MKTILAILRKELKSYFLSPIAYIFITVYLLLTNFLFFQTFFVNNQAEMRSYFSLLPWLFLILIPAITMRTWAEERKNKTLELLLTWPLKDTEIVIGKFLAAVLFLTITLSLSITVPITVAVLGNPDMGVIIGSYVGALLMGSAYIAIGMWVSSLTENQIIAFIGGVIAILVLLLIDHPLITLFAPDFMVPMLSYFGLASHFESICRGVIDSRDVVYYCSVIGFFLFLNVQSLESRKWE